MSLNFPFKSWGKSFCDQVRQRRMVMKLLSEEGPHVALGWANVLRPLGKTKIVEKCNSLIDSHASWLNAEAIAYRRGVGRETINGFYIK